jgi:DNA-directed RNA polymerase specialized sigma24 family protein
MADKSIREIYTITGLSISNIKITLHRARIKLNKYLKFEYEKI